MFQIGVGNITGKIEVAEDLLDEIEPLQMGIAVRKLLQIVLIQQATQQGTKPADIGVGREVVLE